MTAPPLRVVLDPDRITLSAGQSASVAVTVRNVGRTVQHIAVGVVGLPDGATYHPVPDAPVKLLPRTEATVAVEVRLPAEPLVTAGTHVLGMVCRSAHDPSVSRCEQLQLTVESAPALSLTVDRQIVRSTGHARFVATAANTGNTPLTVAFRAKDPEGRMDLWFSPAAMGLAPRQHGHAVLTADAPTLWTGQERQHAIRVDGETDGASAQTTVTLVQRPLLPSGALRLVGGAAGVLAVAGALVGANTLGAQDEEPEGDGTSTESPESTPEADPSPSSSPSEPTPTPTTTTTPPPTPTPTSTVTASPEPPFPDGPMMFDTLKLGLLESGTFESFTISAWPESEACAATNRLQVVKRGDDFLLGLWPSEAACESTPLQVRFDESVRNVVLFVPDDGATYALRVDDSAGRTTPTDGVQPSGGQLVVPLSDGATLRSVIVRRQVRSDDQGTGTDQQGNGSGEQGAGTDEQGTGTGEQGIGTNAQGARSDDLLLLAGLTWQAVDD